MCGSPKACGAGHRGCFRLLSLRVNLQKSGRLFQVRVETVPGQLQTSSFASA